MILVTGATGFLGQHLMTAVKSSGLSAIAVSSRDADLCDPKSLEAYKEKKIEHVFHLAAKTFVPESWKCPEHFFALNVLGTAHVLEFCRATGASMTYVSGYVYGHPKQLPISENHEPMPNNPYAQSKFMGEELCGFYQRAFGVQSHVLRVFNVYGPGQDERFLIPGLIRQVLSGDVIQVHDLRPRRDYVHVTDVVEAILQTYKFRTKSGTYNIGSGVSHSVEEVTKLLLESVGGSQAVKVIGEPRRDELMDTIADITRARGELDWSPRIDLREGLCDLIKPKRNP